MLTRKFNFNFIYGYLVVNALHIGHSRENSILQASQFFFKVFYNFIVINLLHTTLFLKRSLNIFFNFFKKKGDFWFINKENSIKDYISAISLKCGELFLTAKWTAGSLTNFKKVTRSVNRFFFFKKFKGHKDLLFFDNFKGFLFWTVFPKSILLLNPIKNYLVPKEIISLSFFGAISLVDTNVDSNSILYSIPMNDDSSRSLIFISKVFSVKIILSKLRFLLNWTIFRKFRFLRVVFRFKRFRFLKKLLKTFFFSNKANKVKKFSRKFILNRFYFKKHIFFKRRTFKMKTYRLTSLFRRINGYRRLYWDVLTYKSYETYIEDYRLNKYTDFVN